MRFSSVLLLAASALASPLVSRDLNSITAAINSISVKVTQLNNTVNKLNGNPLTSVQTVLNVEENNSELSDALTAATKTVKASTVLNEDDSGTLAGVILNFIPQVESLIDNIVAHKYQFDHAILGTGSVSPQVHLDLTNDFSQTKTFATALTSKLAPDYASLAPIITGPLYTDFQNAITTFSKSGGTFALPAVNGLGAFEQLLKKYL